MKKFGFTLAEILITLGIVGVVAALTTPALINSTQKETNAAKLATTVSSLENAFTTAVVTENVDDVYETHMWLDGRGATFVGNLSKYLAINGYRDNKNAIYGNKNIYRLGVGGSKGVTWNENSFHNGLPILMKNGAVAFIALFDHDLEITEDEAVARGTAMTSVAARVYIDTNGAAEPNIIGRDIFLFWVGQNGVLYPIGGRDTEALQGRPGNDWTSTPQFACPPVNNNATGLGCTARLVAEGYKMNY